MKTIAVDFVLKKVVLSVLIAMVLFFSCVVPLGQPAPLQSTASIALEEFRWTHFPIKVLVDMNQWTQPDYAVAVREALDSWVMSIWNYTNTYNDTTLSAINYLYYLSNVNSTINYGVFITFTADIIPPGPSTVGLTTYSWDLTTRQPVPPITINVTTYSGSANSLFVKDVTMHEFGHALGLGHASSQNTLNGPELMYYASSKNEIVYPSTLDIYGLTEVYNGHFSQQVSLPSTMPYVMLAQGDIPPPQVITLDDFRKYTPLLILLFIAIVVAAVLSIFSREKKTEEDLPPPPPQQFEIISINGQSAELENFIVNDQD